MKVLRYTLLSVIALSVLFLSFACTGAPAADLPQSTAAITPAPAPATTSPLAMTAPPASPSVTLPATTSAMNMPSPTGSMTMPMPTGTGSMTMPMPAATASINFPAPFISGTSITISGYITTEDDFAANLGADTAYMIYMRKMAASGLGITHPKADGTWEFYFFSGKISSADKVNDTWTFSGTGAQLDAWNIVGQVVVGNPKASVPVTVKGTLNGDTATNPGLDADGRVFPVITVSSITPYMP